jgi:hypothetical protein
VSYLKDAEVVPNEQWIASPPVPICNTVYRIVVSTCSLKNNGMISSERRICDIRIFFASCLIRIYIDLYVDFK